MMVMLMVGFMGAAFGLVWSRRRLLGLDSRREACLGALVLTGLMTAAGTPLLSAWHALCPSGLAIFWGLALAGAAVLWQRSSLGMSFPMMSRLEKWMLLVWVVFMGALAFLAVYVPPNSWDAMTYHLSRVAHWQHQQSTGYYPTNIGRQLWTMPLAEYLMMHLQILSGGDVWANMVQWVAWVGCGIGASLVAGYFSVSRSGQMAVLLITASIPMGVLEGTSAQNDLVVALWGLIFVLMLIKWMLDQRRWVYFVWMGAVFALAGLTKGTFYLVAPAFILMAAGVSRRKWVTAGGFLGAVLGGACVMVVLVGAGHLKNTFIYNASPAGVETAQVQNKAMTLPLFVSNLVRHAGVHCQTPFQKVNDVFIHGIEKVHWVLGLSMRDARVTVGDAGFLLAVSAYHEYYAGNFLHFWMGFLCCCLLVFDRKNVFGTVVKYYAASLFVSFIIFILYMRWQPWISRLQLPLFVLGVPVIGVVLYRLDRKGRWLVLAGFLFLAAAIPWVIKGKLKPLTGKKSIFAMTRQERYFINRPYLYVPFVWATDVVRRVDCRRIGLDVGSDAWEYPYWVLLKDFRGIDIRHVGVKDLSQQYADVAWQPCAVIRESDPVGADTLLLNGVVFKRAGYQCPLNIYLPKDAVQ
ncbi:MAG: glycosyltransferase family 39 protein [Candidatus Omnitrophota bacterium]